MNKYKTETYIPPALPDRHYLHTIGAGAWLPFLQATITGVILGSLALVLAFHWRVRSPWTWGGLVAVIAWALCWLMLQRHWFTLTAERLTGLDLNRDGEIGKPTGHKQPEEVRIRISQVKDGSFQESIYTLPGSRYQLRQLAEGLLEYNRPFTPREWTVGKYAPFTDPQFRILRAEMIKRGLVAPASGKDARRGFVLTVVGRRVMTGFLDDLPSPTSPGEAL